MIRRIRRKFIAIAVLVLTLAIVLVTLIVNVANWVSVRGELRETLAYLMPGDGAAQGARGGRGFNASDARPHGLQRRLSESQYFAVIVGPDGSVRLSDTSRETMYTAQELTEIAQRALRSGRTEGFCTNYCYRVEERGSGVRYALFLNCETKLAAVKSLALISGLACAGAVLLAWLLVALFSNRAIRPLIESAAQQKRFITDAGHELKTPLTVISANMDVLELEAGENKWIQSTKKQVANLRSLVGELIYLSRMDEEDAQLQMAAFDLAAALRDAAEPFAGMAEFMGKKLTVDADESLRVRGDEAALKRLVSILCDNAVKYAPEGDEIRLSLRASGKRVTLRMENGLKEPLGEEALGRLFDRFYRADASRSKESGGYGIGLSVARSIAERHGGTIRAAETDAHRLCFTCVLPIAATGKRREA